MRSHRSAFPHAGEGLDEHFDDFRSIQLDEAMRMTEEMGEELSRSTERLLPRLAGERRGRAMTVADRFLPAAESFLDEAESRFLSERERVAGGRGTRGILRGDRLRVRGSRNFTRDRRAPMTGSRGIVERANAIRGGIESLPVLREAAKNSEAVATRANQLGGLASSLRRVDRQATPLSRTRPAPLHPTGASGRTARGHHASTAPGSRRTAQRSRATPPTPTSSGDTATT